MRRYASYWDIVNPEVVHLASGAGQAQRWTAAFEALKDEGLSPQSALRVMRQLVVARLSEMDVGDAVPLEVVTGAMTNLAEFALATAQAALMQELSERHGTPLNQTPGGLHADIAQMWIVGMGKFGARSLNVSSDIDLIYLYEADGETTGAGVNRSGAISNHEFFVKLARGLQSWIADVTEHGFVFRVDLALRPHGNSGPIACSLRALEDYLLVSGREWERFAWLKSRVIYPVLSASHARALRDLVMPFVFRRYLDYRVFDALRDLRSQIRAQAARRAVGRPHRAHDVKLARGGIREVEFLVQVLQVVRGGHFPELRTRPTLKGLERLHAAHLIDAEKTEALSQAYRFLRTLEHHIQYLDDAQTHTLPDDDADLHWIASRMGFASVCALLARLDEHRECVAGEFDALLGAAPEANVDGKCKGCSGPGAPLSSFATGDWDDATGIAALSAISVALAERVQVLAASPKRRLLSEANDQRLRSLVVRTATGVRDARCSEAAALRFIDWLDPLLRRESYLALLVERAPVHERLLKILASSRWAARYLSEHPGVVDELASDHWMHQRFDRAAFEAELNNRHAALQQGAEADEESLMNLLRRAQHAHAFRILARDVNGHLSVEQVADDLSALADSVLKTSLDWIWSTWVASGSSRAHQPQAQLAIVAYGKLGGKELGYGGDLDVVFIHDDPHERAQECYAALAKKLINWLTTKTAQGDLYEIDTALRPNGSAGLLVTHIDSFEQYQSQRGSNTAWTWEHQAITRARVVLGGASLRARFDATRAAVLCSARDALALKAEIADMRARMRRAHKLTSDVFDLKQSPGGMIDVEFAVQCLVLTSAGVDAKLLANVGNIALLEHAQASGLLPTSIGVDAANAYRQFRHRQHAARLDEQSMRLDPADWVAQRAAVNALWDALDLNLTDSNFH